MIRFKIIQPILIVLLFQPSTLDCILPLLSSEEGPQIATFLSRLLTDNLIYKQPVKNVWIILFHQKLMKFTTRAEILGNII